MIERTCPGCGGQWQPRDLRGVLFFHHTRTCLIDEAEVQTLLNDDARRHHAATLVTNNSFDRPATDTEITLLRHLGYAPVVSPPARPTTAPTYASVQWIGSIRRRTWPRLMPTDDMLGLLPDPS